MDNIFINYMNQRFQLRNLSDMPDNPPDKAEKGPVVTISREVGCSGDEFARFLAQRINNHFNLAGKKSAWKWVNKQILFESADQLDIDVSKIKYIFKAEKKGFMDEIVGALASRYYKNDRLIRKTIKKVVDRLAWQGNIIIVGRGGVAYTRDVTKSLHIKLMAPLRWRINNISNKHEISYADAEIYVNEVDEKRKQLVDIFMECKTSDCIFDIILNCQTMETEERLDLIMNILQKREFFS